MFFLGQVLTYFLFPWFWFCRCYHSLRWSSHSSSLRSQDLRGGGGSSSDRKFSNFLKDFFTAKVRVHGSSNACYLHPKFLCGEILAFVVLYVFTGNSFWISALRDLLDSLTDGKADLVMLFEDLLDQGSANTVHHVPGQLDTRLYTSWILKAMSTCIVWSTAAGLGFLG